MKKTENSVKFYATIVILNFKNSYLYLFGPVDLPIQLEGKSIVFRWYTWFRHSNKWSIDELMSNLPLLQHNELQQSSLLVYGDFETVDTTRVRLHSICHTGDIFGSQKCDCGSQLKLALKNIYENGSGALFYLSNHEGRGIGLFSKSITYALQQEGYNTLNANLALGFKADTRNYEEAITILKRFRVKPVILLTNNPDKINALVEEGILIEGSENLVGNINNHNLSYIETKVNDMNHLIPL